MNHDINSEVDETKAFFSASRLFNFMRIHKFCRKVSKCESAEVGPDPWGLEGRKVGGLEIKDVWWKKGKGPFKRCKKPQPHTLHAGEVHEGDWP